jgi:chaperonin GroEL
MRGALREGIVPGGGAAFLACRPALKARLKTAVEPEERMAFQILLNAMEEPLRTLLHNAGFKPDEIWPRLAPPPAGTGFNVAARQVVNMVSAGIIDGAAVTRQAAVAAVSGAALALTTDVIVHRADPPESMDTA